MRKIIENRKLLIYFILIIFVAGGYSYNLLPKQESPDISAPVAIVSCVYPGASQDDVEQLVTSKIEEELKDIEGYKVIKSFAVNSYTSIIFEVVYGTNAEKTWDTLRTKMTELQDDLPEECHTIDVRTDITETAGMIIALSGEGYSYEALNRYGESFIEQLSSINGIRRFEIDGKIDKEVRIKLNTDKINRLDISYSELLRRIQGQNIEIPSGLIEEGNSVIPLRIKGSLSSLSEIENIIVAASKDNQSVLRIKDIGQVYYQDSDSGIRYKNNGNNAILLTGYFKDEQNVLLIGDDVRQMIDSFKMDLPKDIHFEEIIFQPNDVSKSINTFMMNLVQGILLVIVVVFIGMGFRNAIIVSTAIPLAIIMTFLTMPLFNVRIHEISVVGLIVALGMLVDNAIVVSDSIQYKLDAGEERMEACVNGAKEVLMPVFSSTLTTVATLIPLLLLNSISGDFVKALPMVVIIALSASFIIAVVVTPTFAYMFFKPKKKSTKDTKERRIHRWIYYAIEHRLTTFIICLIILGGLGFSATQLDVIFFPKVDKNVMYINVEADENIDRDYTESIINQVETILKEEEGVISYTTAIGGGIPKFYSSMMVYAEAVQNGQIMLQVDLSATPYEKNTAYAQYIQEKIDKNLIGGKATIKELENAMPIDATITVRLKGDNYEELYTKANEVTEILKSIDGTKNVRTNYSEKKLEYTIDLDENELLYLGLSKYDVLNEVSIALRGRKSSTFRKDGEEYAIILSGDNVSVNSIENLMIKSSITGNKHLLKDIGTVELVDQQPIIHKYNGTYAITIMSDIHTGYQRGTILENFHNQFEKIQFGTITYKFDGEAEKIKENFGSAGQSAIIAIIIIYSILLLQFRSYSQPIIILVTVPLSSVGALWGLFIMGQPISFTGLIGIISLIGIVVNNAIVLLDYINMKRKEGFSILEACRTASIIRLRPIMVSTITTISGLLPLLVSNSELFKPMAVSLVFGLLISTLLTLVFIPVTYILFIRGEA